MTDDSSVSTSRRVFLGLTAIPLAGCTTATYSSDPGNQSTTSEPSDMDRFARELESAGIEVDSTMTLAGGASVFYMRNPDAHREQLETVADRFVFHREVVAPGGVLSVTALTDDEDRHGVVGLPREWAEQVASGDLRQGQYFDKVIDEYMTV